MLKFEKHWCERGWGQSRSLREHFRCDVLDSEKKWRGKKKVNSERYLGWFYSGWGHSVKNWPLRNGLIPQTANTERYEVYVTVFLLSSDSQDCCVLILFVGWLLLDALWETPWSYLFSVSRTDCSLVKLCGQLSIHAIDILVDFIPQRTTLFSSRFSFCLSWNPSL